MGKVSRRTVLEALTLTGLPPRWHVRWQPQAPGEGMGGGPAQTLPWALPPSSKAMPLFPAVPSGPLGSLTRAWMSGEWGPPHGTHLPLPHQPRPPQAPSERPAGLEGMEGLPHREEWTPGSPTRRPQQPSGPEASWGQVHQLA